MHRTLLLAVPKQRHVRSVHTVLVISFVLLHTVHTCLLLRNFQQKLIVAVHSQDSIRTCKPHAVDDQW